MSIADVAATGNELFELAEYLVTVGLPALVGIVTLIVSNRHARKLAAKDQSHQVELAQRAAADARTERRYGERQACFMRLIDAATLLRDNSLQREYRGDEPPAAFLDGPELDSHFKPLREALNEVLLVGSAATRRAAESLAKATESYVWDWSADDYRALDQALIDFRAAARVDLGIDGGQADAPSDKPRMRGTGA